MLVKYSWHNLRSIVNTEKVSFRKNWVAQCTEVAETGWNLKYAFGNLEKEVLLQARESLVGTAKGEERCSSSG